MIASKIKAQMVVAKSEIPASLLPTSAIGDYTRPVTAASNPHNSSPKDLAKANFPSSSRSSKQTFLRGFLHIIMYTIFV
jgi:hypothetical protein